MRLECLMKAQHAGSILLTHGDGPAGIFRAPLECRISQNHRLTEL